MKMIRMKFTTAAGKPYSVNLNYAKPILETEEGKDFVQAAIDAIMKHQPFSAVLAESKGADLVDRQVTEVL